MKARHWQLATICVAKTLTILLMMTSARELVQVLAGVKATSQSHPAHLDTLVPITEVLLREVKPATLGQTATSLTYLTVAESVTVTVTTTALTVRNVTARLVSV